MTKLLDATGKVVAHFVGYSEIDGCETWQVLETGEIICDYDIPERFGATTVKDED